MTTKTVQKHLLLHGFFIASVNYVNKNREKLCYGNCFMVTACAQKHLKYKQKLFRTMHLCKLNYVNDSEIHVFT